MSGFEQLPGEVPGPPGLPAPPGPPPGSWGAAPTPPPPGPPPSAWGAAPGAPPQYPGGYQPYAQGPQAFATNPFDSRGSTIMVLGILALVLCPFILGPTAWVMGNSLKKDAIAAGYPEPGNGKAGRICGIIGTVLAALTIVFYIVILVVAATGSSSTY